MFTLSGFLITEIAMETPPYVNRRHRKAMMRLLSESLLSVDLSIPRRVEYWFNDWSLRFGVWESANIERELAALDRLRE